MTRSILYKFMLIVLIAICAVTVLNPFEALSLDSIPPGDDSRAHIYRVSGFLEEYIINKGMSLKQYNGMILLSYAPLFYVVLYPLSLAYGPVAAYKFGRIFICMLYLLSVYLLVRELGISRKIAILITPIALYFPTMWFIYYKGAYPYLFSWSLTLISVSLLLMYRRILRYKVLVLSAVVGGLSILAHSYGLINIAVFLVIWMLHNLYTKGFRDTAKNFFVYFLITSSVSLPYLISVLITFRDASPLNEASPCIWIPGLAVDPINLLIIAISIYTVVYFLRVENRSIGRDIIAHCLLTYTLISLISTILIYIKIPSPLLMKTIALILPWRFLYINNATFITLSLAFNRHIILLSEKRSSSFLFIAILVTIALITSTIITSTLALYEKPIDKALPSFVDIVKNSRVLVIGTPLILSNSPVAFSTSYNYTTSTGSYNQGDPTFFDLTVYYEWINTLVKNPIVLENIMELTRSRYLITDLDIGIKFTPTDASINTSEWYFNSTMMWSKSLYKILCLFRKPLTLSKFSSFMVKLKDVENATVRMWIVQENGLEEEMILIHNAINRNNSNSYISVFQLPYRRSAEDVVVRGINMYISVDSNTSIDPRTGIEIRMGTLNMIKINSYSYRGYIFTLYEYYRDPPLSIASKVVLFDTENRLPKILTLLASEGYNSIFIVDNQKIPENIVAGVVTDSIEKAKQYITEGYRTVLLKYGDKFDVKNQTEKFVYIETPLINSHILPHDPGNPASYVNWDRIISAEGIQRYVMEATKLWHFLKNFMNISVEVSRASIRYSPPEVDVEIRNNQVHLIKIAYTSIWNADAELLRSSTGFIIVLPSNNTLIKIQWNPPLIDTAVQYSIATLTTSLLYVAASKIKEFIKRVPKQKI
ncbi:MAG: hypothetical protein QW101_03630 [Ignisphaera sp.]|uniref:Uncharacterized protein n=2 Tax=Ignisphaera aggregans TaxID=334771 RepID=A0A832AUK1_9CREN